jgi:hypothetical protein
MSGALLSSVSLCLLHPPPPTTTHITLRCQAVGGAHEDFAGFAAMKATRDLVEVQQSAPQVASEEFELSDSNGSSQHTR